MRRALACAFVGALYGAPFGMALVLFMVTGAVAVESAGQPADLVGLLSALPFFLLLGSVLGGLSGACFGLVGAVVNRPRGWPLAGLVAGAVFWQLHLGFVWLMTRQPAQPDAPVTHVSVLLVPLCAFAALGFLVEHALQTGRPALPHLERLRPVPKGPARGEHPNP